MSAIHAERNYVIEEDFMKAVRKVADAKKLESMLSLFYGCCCCCLLTRNSQLNSTTKRFKKIILVHPIKIAILLFIPHLFTCC